MVEGRRGKVDEVALEEVVEVMLARSEKVCDADSAELEALALKLLLRRGWTSGGEKR